MKKGFKEAGKNFGRHPVVSALTKTNNEPKNKTKTDNAIKETSSFRISQHQTKERKDRRMQLLFKSSTYNFIHEEAKKNGLSVNETVSQILDLYREHNNQ